MNMQRGGTKFCNFPEPEVTTSQAPTRPPLSCTPPRRPPPPSSARPAPRRTHHTPCKRIFTCRCNKKIHCRNFFKRGHIRCIELCNSRHCLLHVGIFRWCFERQSYHIPNNNDCQCIKYLPVPRKTSQKTFTNKSLCRLIQSVYKN